MPERGAVAPARVQSRRKIGLQHQYRLGRQSDRTGGQVLGDYLAEHLFEPIGMKDTAFNLTQDRRARLAGMHARLRTANGCAR